MTYINHGTLTLKIEDLNLSQELFDLVENVPDMEIPWIVSERTNEEPLEIEPPIKEATELVWHHIIASQFFQFPFDDELIKEIETLLMFKYNELILAEEFAQEHLTD